MAQKQHSPERTSFFLPPDSRAMENQPTSTADSATEDMAGEADEPPDPLPINQKLKVKSLTCPDFKKSACMLTKRNSLLTRILHSSESDSHVDEDDTPFFEASRVQSSASIHSRGSVASMCDLTSDGHTSPTRTSSPSPPLPPVRFAGLPSNFNRKPSSISFAPKQAESTTGASEQETIKAPNEQTVEAGLGRKRCITFACGGNAKKAVEVVPEVKEAAPQVTTEEPPKRKCMLKFVCPSRENATPAKAGARLSSPPPASRRLTAPKSPAPRTHRGSDATVRNPSPKVVRKVPSAIRTRRESDDDVDRSEATRFHEFASSEEETADWTQESTCHRRPLTVYDTLSIENQLRKIGQEVEEEEEEEVEEEEEADEAAVDDDTEEDDDEEDVSEKRSVASGFESDDGFQTDDEQGFGPSDDESDAGSDYDWWAPGKSNVRDQIEHIRPTVRRNSDSSIETINHDKRLRHKRSSPVNVTNGPPELPDSTDFVCGTLDEDKPLEHAWMTHLEKRRAAKHKVVPQDIDPTFPTSDFEMDEEDEVSEAFQHSESDHPIFLHGHMEPHEEAERQPRGTISRKRSPLHSPKRLRSPPPAKRFHRSPPPHRRAKSPPPPHRRAKSPPPPRPLIGRQLSSSVPRNQQYKLRGRSSMIDDAEDLYDDTENTPRLPTRRAIDIVKGLEKKRQRRREKLYEKHCRKAVKSKDKKPAPGKGCERMRDLALELAKARGKCTAPTDAEVHMLSF